MTRKADMQCPVVTSRPSKEDIKLLLPYERLPIDRIHVIDSRSQEAFVVGEIARLGVVGFDTETKPVFVANTRPDGPHVIQLATLEHAFIFQVHRCATLPLLQELLASEQLLKVGFGLNSDRGPLHRKLGITLQNFVDVAHAFRRLGYRQPVGAKAAVAIALGKWLQKSKSQTKSNWIMNPLSPSQLHYAADDAHAALAVYLALGCPMAVQRKVGPRPSLHRTRSGVSVSSND